MTILYINGIEAIVPEETNMEIEFENPFFSSASTYTLDVELPMPENIKIFGAVQRIDTKKKRKTYKAKLISNGIVILTGSAVVVGVTDAEIKVQLMSGNSELNFQLNEEVYLDEIDTQGTKGVYLGIKYNDDWYQRIGYNIDGYHWAVNYTYPMMNIYYYLYSVVNKIINRYGYKTRKSILESTWMRKIVIFGVHGAVTSDEESDDNKKSEQNNFNSLNSITHWPSKISLDMPHWTLKEFFSNLEKFASVIIKVDENTKEVDILDSKDYFSQEAETIDYVLDEYETEIDDEANEESTMEGNIAYDFPSDYVDNYQKLSDDVLNNTKKVKKNTVEEIKNQWALDGKPVDRIYMAENRSFITKDKEFTEVDIWGDLIRDETDEDKTKLKIIPASIIQENVGLYEFINDWWGSEKKCDMTANVIKSNINIVNSTEWITNIQGFIDDDDSINNESDKDVMEVVLVDDTTIKTKKGTYTWPMPFIDYSQTVENQLNEYEKCSLSLKNTCDNSIGKRILDQLTIDTKVVYTFTFKLNKVPDLTKPFIIKNQRYVAKELKTTITGKGWDHIFSGDFYRFD